MAIEFVCPHCKTALSAPDHLKGTSGRCPRCAKELTVPKASADTKDGRKTKAKRQ